MSTQTKRLCLCGYCSLHFISGCNYGRKVLRKLNDVEGLLTNGVFEVLAEKCFKPKGEKKHIQASIGLDKRVEMVCSYLQLYSRRTFGLYGMGGIGKTTLLANQILRRLGLDKDWEQDTEEERAHEIYNILKGRKFVLLLDDLWSKLDLNKLGEFTLSSHPDIPALTRVVAGKCNGLPLALNAIGKTMTQKMAVQEDYEIEKNELTEYWLWEGFIDGNRDDDGANKEGLDIIKLLVSAHLLINDGVTMKVKMHDVIPEDISSKVVRRMSFMKNQIAEISCSPKCSDLSTLLLENNKLVDISGEFFRFMPSVVVLDLSENKRLIGLPEEISNLGSLKYLNLSHTRIKSLPVGLKNLRKLIYLNLDYTYKLRSIINGRVATLGALTAFIVLPSTSSPSFKNLSSILITDLEGPRDLTWLAFAQNLVYLHVMRSSSIEEIINKENGVSISNKHPHFVAPFRKLEYLTVTEMDELKIICGYPRTLRKLTEFIVRNCPKLPLSLRDNGEYSWWIGTE
ncbi:P-loop containing nucleoside triphosphate hydrolase [Arabidopsis suecica]|uniref:P-loop containing nucleoside triphosphate hydrolase n=1 Tax=Arabidopsis suecica TaxID=45249 RepID=A0A8T2CQG1_ARASU|nr:P-loop containing nucleoside triphosphate hydrolase [Arabidopsis suecica]